MNKYLIGAFSVAIMSAASLAYAQTTAPSLSGTVTPGTTTGTPQTIGIDQGLGIMFNVAQSIPAGGNEEALALIALDATQSTDGIAVQTIPVQMVFNGATPDEFSNCSLRNVSDLGTALNTGANALGAIPSSASAIAFQLDSPLVVPPGSSVVIALTCDIAAQTPAGGTVTLSINPASIPAEDVSTGATIVPAADLSASTGQPMPTYGTVTIAAAASTSATSPTSQSSPYSTTAPGVPNTGAGGEAPANMLALAFSGILALLGSSLLARRFARQS